MYETTFRLKGLWCGWGIWISRDNDSDFHLLKNVSNDKVIIKLTNTGKDTLKIYSYDEPEPKIQYIESDKTTIWYEGHFNMLGYKNFTVYGNKLNTINMTITLLFNKNLKTLPSEIPVLARYSDNI